MLVGTFELNRLRRQNWMRLELYLTPKIYHLKRNRIDYQLLAVQERSPGYQNGLETTAEIKPKNRNESGFCYLFQCTLTDIVTVKNSSVSP